MAAVGGVELLKGSPPQHRTRPLAKTAAALPVVLLPEPRIQFAPPSLLMKVPVVTLTALVALGAASPAAFCAKAVRVMLSPFPAPLLTLKGKRRSVEEPVMVPAPLTFQL